MFVFYDDHHARLGNYSATDSPWSGDWQHYQFILNQLSFMSLHFVGEKDQEIVDPWLHKERHETRLRSLSN